MKKNITECAVMITCSILLSAMLIAGRDENDTMWYGLYVNDLIIPFSIIVIIFVYFANRILKDYFKEYGAKD